MNQIRNSDDLRAAIEELRNASTIQQAAIKVRFAGPKAIFKTVFSLFPSTEGHNWKHWLRPALRFLPATAIRLFFGRSSFIVKSLIGLTGQAASKFL